MSDPGGRGDAMSDDLFTVAATVTAFVLGLGAWVALVALVFWIAR